MDAVADLLAGLVAVDSTNPDLVPGGAGEADIAAFAAAWLERAGLEVSLEEAAPGRPNVIARAVGSGRGREGRSLLLNAHMDVVGVEGMTDPFTPRIEAGRLYGRGAFDMKGGLAAIMLAAARVAGAGLRGDVIVTAVCDEEYASLGSEAIAARVWADAAIVTEPTGLDVCVAHKGFLWLEIETEGVAAHGSRPDLGVDAIAAMGNILTGLEQLARTLSAGRSHPLLGPGSIHASLIEGGRELSSYPDRCRLSVERRTIPGESRELVERQVRELAAGATVPARRSSGHRSRSTPAPTSWRPFATTPLRCSAGSRPWSATAPGWTRPCSRGRGSPRSSSARPERARTRPRSGLTSHRSRRAPT